MNRQSSSPERPRALFVTSGGSIAHTWRTIPVAQELRRRGWRVLYGARGPYTRFVTAEGFKVLPLPTLDYSKMIRWMDNPLALTYSPSELGELALAQQRYVAAIRPDVIIQDGPDSTISFAAASCGVPCFQVVNASVRRIGCKIRSLPFWPRWNKLVGSRGTLAAAVEKGIDAVRTASFAPQVLFTLKRYRQLQRGQQAAYIVPDLAELFAVTDLRGQPPFVGPILYEPKVEKPAWWSSLDGSRPLLYLGVGSSEGVSQLRTIIEALADTRFLVALSTAGDLDLEGLPQNFLYAPFLPRDELLQKTDLMIAHGGNATMYQCLKHAVPMVLIPGNLDHDMNAVAAVKQGVATMVLPQDLNASSLLEAIERTLGDPQMAKSLKRFQKMVASSNAPVAVADLVEQHIGAAQSAPLAEVAAPTMESAGCDLCGCIESAAHSSRRDRRYQIGGDYQLVKCAQCGFVYLNPRPTAESLDEFFPLEFPSLADCFGLSPKTDRQLKRRFDRYLALIRRLFDPERDHRLLQVGCGNGAFIEYLLDQVGCRAWGVEPHPVAADIAVGQQLRVLAGHYCDLDNRCFTERFDLVCFFDSLELQLSARKSLERTLQLLLPGGYLLALTAAATRAPDLPRQRFLFDSHSLARLATECGFAGVSCQAVEPGQLLLTGRRPPVAEEQ